LFAQSTNKWAQLVEGVYGKRGGINTTNVGKLGMWCNKKMKFVTFIHNDDAKCFHMVVQGTHKFVMIGCITFKDHALIKRRQVGQKMNVTIKKFKDK
jgi:hypothetical protein